jgi:hypothetical protein
MRLNVGLLQGMLQNGIRLAVFGISTKGSRMSFLFFAVCSNFYFGSIPLPLLHPLRACEL